MRESSRSTSDSQRCGHPVAGREPATVPGKKKPAGPAPRKNTAASGEGMVGREPATGAKPLVPAKTLGRDPATKAGKR